jgi:phosphatidylinositol kinase/protein kinase (PI-3  family)
MDDQNFSVLQGWFRKSGESVLSVLRDNRDSLKSALESFIYDPLVEWTRVKSVSFVFFIRDFKPSHYKFIEQDYEFNVRNRT